jgi:hypothetical protein
MSRGKRDLGERLHTLFLQAYGLKERDFAEAAVDRAMATLNAARAPKPPMVGEVLWMSPPVAFHPARSVLLHFASFYRTLRLRCAGGFRARA